MSYTEGQFQGCMFNPLVKGKMLDVYQKLNEIIEEDWRQAPQLDKIIRYVMVVYDPKSPLHRDSKDLVRRKTVAAELVDFRESEDFLKEIFDGTNEVCLGLIIKFLIRFVKEKEYAALCAFEFKYYENIAELMTPIVGISNADRLDAAKKKSVISQEIINDIKVISELWNGFFEDGVMVEKVKRKKFIPEMM